MKNLTVKPPIAHKLTRQTRRPDALNPNALILNSQGFITSELLIGIDVSKDELAIDSEQGLFTLANTLAAIDAWLKHVDQQLDDLLELQLPPENSIPTS
ncbi:hypothetical protein NP603_00840 [Methylomonas sp. SURF-1]|uniref:Transposase n=1 Tax=Methylomonas aurea TaxID=2952224 RepID=A0ABT1UBN8_9GAMM|nr:hypothetical protein [Methylomonas sp. SURF-1]MCQ8179640.1 hypothetical protein [Methylomonas sp. SURF-1]